MYVPILDTLQLDLFALGDDGTPVPVHGYPHEDPTELRTVRGGSGKLAALPMLVMERYGVVLKSKPAAS